MTGTKQTRYRRFILGWLSMACLAGWLGCAGVTHVGNGRYPEHEEQVFVSEKPLPSDLGYEVIAELELGENYHGARHPYEALAQKARQVGAHAVMEAENWAGHGIAAQVHSRTQGVAVRFVDRQAVDFSRLEGKFY